ncbi:MAG: PHB depolymerase family esterase [Pseudomonadota bacterium]
MRSSLLSLPLIAGVLAFALPDIADACGNAPEDLCATQSGEYRIAMPEGVDAPGAMIWLHGWGGSANGVMKNTGMIAGVAARGMALIAPDGRVTSKRWKNKNWAVNDGRPYERDDIAFMAEVLDDAAAKHGIDRDRVLLAGFSRGGSMVWDVACRTPGLAKAYAPVAGAFWEPMWDSCEGPVDLYHTHGWTDRTVPLEGRSLADGTMIQGDVFQSLFILRATNGCGNRQPESAPIDPDADLWGRTWSDCASGRRIDLLLHPGGHGIPKGWLNRTLDWFDERVAADSGITQ